MTLFGSGKKESPTIKKVRPTVIRTQNVAKELMALAKSYGVKVETLDFNILEVQTYTRMADDKNETDWVEIDEFQIEELDENDTFLNPLFEIKQVYEVEIYSKDADNDPYRDFYLAVGANATKCKIYLNIKEGSSVSYIPSFARELHVLINKSKVRAGILINIFDEMMDDVISKISAHVKIQENAFYETSETILIAQSYEPTLTRNDELVLHFDKKEKPSEHERINYASRGFIHSVHKDELLIEYIKAKEGIPGRNCRGEFMRPRELEISHEPTFTVDETIKVIETSDNIEYRAKENGYIAFENNVYLIKTDVDIGEISFKTTGSISTGLDSDVSINVKEADAIKDAIGTGMVVEVSEIEVEGNVGPNARVDAIKATIGGQTHKTAQIRADELKIHVHKGRAYGKHIHITRLEHGEIDGDIIDITQALGGEVRGKEVAIEICGSYVKATASKRIEIKKLHGSENVFTIDPLLKKGNKKGFDENEKNIKVLENDIKSISREIESYTKTIKGNTATFNDVKRRLINYKKNGVKMPESFVKQYKQFQKAVEHLESIKKEIAAKKDQLLLLTTRTASYQDNIFDARIINRDRWVGHNEIRFKLVDPPIEIKFNPPEGSLGKVFGLVEVDDGEYAIKVVKE